MWLWRARSFIFRAPGPSPGPAWISFPPGAFTYPSHRFPLLCKQNQQTTPQSLQHQKVIPFSPAAGGSCFRKPWQRSPREAACPPLYWAPGGGRALPRRVCPGVDKFIFIKNASQQRLAILLRRRRGHVFVPRAAQRRSLISGVSLDGCACALPQCSGGRRR